MTSNRNGSPSGGPFFCAPRGTMGVLTATLEGCGPSIFICAKPIGQPSAIGMAPSSHQNDRSQHQFQTHQSVVVFGLNSCGVAARASACRNRRSLHTSPRSARLLPQPDSNGLGHFLLPRLRGRLGHVQAWSPKRDLNQLSSTGQHGPESRPSLQSELNQRRSPTNSFTTLPSVNMWKTT